MRWRHHLCMLAAAGLLAGCGGGGSGETSEPLVIATLSNRADLISDGNALVEVTMPSEASARTLKVEMNGHDVTSAFTSSTGTRRQGLLNGLNVGRNTITARADGARAADLIVTNAPRGGPVLAGTQLMPYVCATREPRAATATTAATNASGFSTEAVDAQCNTASETQYFYRTTQVGCSLANPHPTPAVNSCFMPYTVGSPAPDDLAMTTTESGMTVPYIVRVERGVINRGIYETAVLVDPAKPWVNGLAPQSTWTGKVQFLLGGSSGQVRRQFRPASNWTDDPALAKGWMVVTNSLIDGARNTNRTVMVDTVLMMKEDIVERYGPIKHTVGTGCSAGSMSAFALSSAYPGLLDGLLVSCALNDAESSNQESSDCSLLVEAYDRPRWRQLMADAGYSTAEINRKKAAINGHADHTACIGWFNSFSLLRFSGNYSVQRQVTPENRDTGVITERALTETNNCQLPPSQVYTPGTNPGGQRCSHFEHAVAVWGKRPDGDANSTRDNTGVQYGLLPLQEGVITPEEFVTLNEVMGSFNRNGLKVPERAVADLPALETAYRSGLMPDPKMLARVPVLDFRGYDDSLTPPTTGSTGRSGLHQIWRSFANQERLLKGNGTFGNYAMWRYGLSPRGFNPTLEMAAEGLFVMDSWLTAANAESSGTPESRILRNRPTAAADFCILSTDPTQTVRTTDKTLCDADPLLKPGRSPREGAGGPRSNDVLKCQLKPIDAADYLPAVFTAAQLNRLSLVFSDGVCDYRKPGVGAQPTWGVTSFAAGPGGQPLPAAPVSNPR